MLHGWQAANINLRSFSFHVQGQEGLATVISSWSLADPVEMLNDLFYVVRAPPKKPNLAGSRVLFIENRTSRPAANLLSHLKPALHPCFRRATAYLLESRASRLDTCSRRRGGTELWRGWKTIDRFGDSCSSKNSRLNVFFPKNKYLAA